MKTKLFLITFAIIAISSNALFAAYHDRSEIKRYTLYRDRVITDKVLTKERFKNFLEIDLFFSSGIKGIIGDISDGLDSSSNPIQKQLNVAEVLSKYINQEKYLDIGITVGTPLPVVKIKRHRFLPGLFFDINVSTLFSIDNKKNALDPQASIFLKKDIKYGLNSKYKWNQKKEFMDFSLYKLTRSDFGTAKTSSQIVSDDNLLDLDSLDEDEKILAFDIKYVDTQGKSTYTYEMREFKLYSFSDSKDCLYGTTPYLRIEFDRLFSPQHGLSFFIGEHYRQRYSLFDGLYIGLKMRPLKRPPLAFLFTLNSDFMTFIPQLKTKWFQADYKLKIPHRNPRDEIWASTVHSISINIPFP